MSEAASAPSQGASLTLRLVGAALVWMLVLLSAGGIVLTAAFRDSATQEFGQRLDALLRAMIAVMDIGPDGAVVIVRPLGDPRFEQVFSGWYWQVAEPSGRLVRSRSLWDSTLPTHDDGTESRRREIVGPKGEALVAVERDLRYAGTAGPVHVMIAGDRRELDARIRSFDLLLAAALGVFALGMAAAIVLQVRFGLKPLRTVAADLGAVRGGRVSRLAGSYPREVAPLAQAMNAVLDHDAVLIERARTHLGNLAHSLKTPLAVLRAELAGVPDKAVAETQIRVMTRQIEHHLARAASGAASARALGVHTALAPIAADIAKVLARIHPDKGIVSAIDIPAGLTLPLAREDIEEMLGNLMENAWKWAKGRVRVAAEPAGDLVSLRVEDDGPGLTPAEAAAAAARGARLDEAMPGWGLGLAIVGDLAAVNGGALEIARSELGGVKAVLTLPRAA